MNLREQIYSVNRIMKYCVNILSVYNWVMSELKKLSFGFTPEDDQLLTDLKERLKDKYGSMTNIAVIRVALRELARDKR